jgi:hypothetical protein
MAAILHHPQGGNAMPIHDWTRVDANLFHDFHQTWTVTLCNALNRGLLPKGYSALVEPHAAGVLPDSVFPTPQEIQAARGNRISIRHPLNRAISVLDIVSPGNKASRAALRAFVQKTVDFLKHGVHLLVIDLFRPSVRDPQGVHKAIWDEIEDQPFELPADKLLTLAAYVADVPKTAYVEPIGVGDVLPDMPLFLTPEVYMSVPLEATYQATWASCPEVMREAVERGEPLSNEPAED